MSPEQLYKLGFSLILLQPKRKQPMDGKWSQGPRIALYDILDGLDDGCNLGFRPGITSKTAAGKFIHVIDVDIRNEELTDEAFAALEQFFGKKFLKACARVKSGSGGASRHFYFTMDRPMRAKTIAHSRAKFKCPKTGKMRWEWEIEVFGEGKQIVLPPSIHPDTGDEYEWLKKPDQMPNLDSDILDQILDDLTKEAADYAPEDLKPLGMKLSEARGILDALDHETWFIEREGWRNVGMALHHEFGGSDKAYKLWSEFSKKAPNFDANEQRYQWGTFGRNDRVRPFRMASLIKEAHEAEVRDAFQPSEEDLEEIREHRKEQKKRRDKIPTRISKSPSSVKTGNGQAAFRIKQPKFLMTVPGILGEIVDLYNATAPMPQPQFAVQTALALGSVILGRNWVTDENNYASTYYLMLGRTATGKEHGLKLIGKVLEECELDLIGPPRFTSDAGIMSALEVRPKQISLADEFSRYLKASRSSGDANQSNAQSTLMEIWGRLDGVHRNKGYSTRGMSKAQILEMANSHVKRPALSMLGVATPDDFYNAIGGEDVQNGFLNRFLIVETELPRLPMQKGKKRIKVDPKFRKWARENAFPVTGEDEDIMDAINGNSAVEAPDPVEVPFSRNAVRVLDDIDEFVRHRMGELDATGMEGLYGRVREIIMRLSLIIARSCEEDEILAEHVNWAREYVYYHTEKLYQRTKDDMGASELQQIVNMTYKMIEDASEDDNQLGLTSREMTTNCWKFRNLDTRSREEVAKLLMQDRGVVIRTLKRPGGRNIKMFTLRDEE